MTSSPAASSPSHDLFHSRGWLIAGGILSLLVGFAAIGSPLLYSVVIAQLLGIFALVSGVIAFVLAIFGRHTHHRILEAVMGLIRIVAGIALLVCVTSSVLVITLILAVFLIVEGIFIAAAALRMRSHQGWIWTLISGLAAIVLGVMIYAGWPSSSAWVLGTLFGINLIFNGSSLLALGLGARRPEAA